MNLADTLSHELVKRYHIYNFGETDYSPRWAFSLEKNDPKDFMEGVNSFVNLGGAVSQRQAREILGITEPEEGEPVLAAQQQPEPGQPGQQGQPEQGGSEQDILSQLMGSAPQPPNGQQSDKEFRAFAKKMNNHYKNHK